WRLHHGKQRSDGSPVTIFCLDKKEASEEELKAGLNAVKRSRTLRHPNVLKFLGSTDSETMLAMATEEVMPLQQLLDDAGAINDLGIAWGILQVTKALEFLAGAGFIHRNVGMGAIFVTSQGDWKLGGMELLCTKETPYEELPMPPCRVYEPPEVIKGQHGRGHVWSVDMWGLGCLIHEAHHGLLENPEELKTMSKMPKSIIPHYAVLISTNPKTRPSPREFLDQGRAPGKYFKNEFIDAVLFLEELAVKEKEDVSAFYGQLPKLIDEFPRDLCIKKILPQLLQAFQFGGAGYQVLAPMLKIGKLLQDDEYTRLIVPNLVQLFASPDRATRISLLKKLGDFIGFLSSEVISNDIFPHVAQGFGDTVPAMREETVKAMLHFAPKLKAGILDQTVTKSFPKLQADEKPGIRTNTTVCLAKIAPHLSTKTRSAVLASAFLKATKDPFLHARVAGLSGLSVCIEYFTATELAKRVLPIAAPAAVDPEESVRIAGMDAFFRHVSTALASRTFQRDADLTFSSGFVMDQHSSCCAALKTSCKRIRTAWLRYVGGGGWRISSVGVAQCCLNVGGCFFPLILTCDYSFFFWLVQRRPR
ncbi:uncharacterized protein MONBRDRAFT_15474, partial [Monosiga brevicollis MX1]